MNINSLGYVWIESTDPSRWLSFGTQVLGMMSCAFETSDDNIYLKMDERPYRLAIYKGDRDRLALCGWELQGKSDFDQICITFDKLGVDYKKGSAADCLLRKVKEFVRLKDPGGNTLELYWGSELDYVQFVSPVGVKAFVTGKNGSMGLGHAVLPTTCLADTYAFYKNVLGFDDSDYLQLSLSDSPEKPDLALHFLHVNNPRHHSLALMEQSNNPTGCVHLMVEVPACDDVGYCMDRVSENAIPVVSTLGRHCNDNMLSFYMSTPAGFAMEYGCEGLQPDWAQFTPTVSTVPSLWGHQFTDFSSI